jgi:hypothetical protein
MLNVCVVWVDKGSKSGEVRSEMIHKCVEPNNKGHSDRPGNGIYIWPYGNDDD